MLSESLVENKSLKDFNSFRIESFARYYAEVNEENISSLNDFAKEKNLEIILLGGGTNVLFAKENLNALVLHFKDTQTINLDNDLLKVSASYPLAKIMSFATKESLANYEFLAGIPGTIGGAVCMNAGSSPKEKRYISDLFLRAKVFDFENSKFKILEKVDMDFAYRNSILQNKKYALLEVFLNAFQKDNSSLISENIKQIKMQKAKAQPDNSKNAGSIFKSVNGKSAGFYIEECGLKNFAIGDAVVSEKHANWILNSGMCKGRDVLNLISFIKEKVYEKFSITLETEIQIFGDKK